MELAIENKKKNPGFMSGIFRDSFWKLMIAIELSYSQNFDFGMKIAKNGHSLRLHCCISCRNACQQKNNRSHNGLARHEECPNATFVATY